MNIEYEMEKAKLEKNLERLDEIAKTCFCQSELSIAPFAASVELTEEGERLLGSAEEILSSAEPGMGAEDQMQAAGLELGDAAQRFGLRGVGLALANQICRARREIIFDLKTISGFDGTVIVSEGDSWFQYPFVLDDVVDQLSEDNDKAILSLGGAGDLVAAMADRGEYVEAINRTGAHVFLLSGGGNDILGDGRFLEVLKPFADVHTPRDLIDEAALERIMSAVRNDYRRIVDEALSTRPDIRIFGHAYDTPFPAEDGRWIGNALETKGIPFDLGRKIVAEILGDFAGFLSALDDEIANYTFVDVRGEVGGNRNSWYNEIHPKNAGFDRIANKFREALSANVEISGPRSRRTQWQGDALSLLRNTETADEIVAGPESFGTSKLVVPSLPAHLTRSTVSLALNNDEREIAAAADGTGGASVEDRERMARKIIDFEARRDSRGRIKVHYLDPDDGGGRYEVAGINERYHKEEADHLVALIRANRHEEAESFAAEFIATYTDGASRWCQTVAIEFYLRDCMFNRGPGGAAWIVQHAVGVVTDRRVGPITRAAIRSEERDPARLLVKLRTSREVWERKRGRDESSRYWRGLVNRWNKALRFAETFLDEATGTGAEIATAAPMPQPAAHGDSAERISDLIFNCEPSQNTEDDWTIEAAETAHIISDRLPAEYPEEFDLRALWWRVGDQEKTGSCVGWAAADSVFRWHFVKNGRLNENEPLSERFIWMAAKETDEFVNRPTTFIEGSGTSLKAALDVARKFGNVRRDVLPVDRNKVFTGSANAFYIAAAQLKIAAYVNLGRDPDHWRRWIYENGPILSRLYCDEAFLNAKSTQGLLKNYQHPGRVNGHAIALVGYTKAGFIVRNSWGTERWGHNGFALATNDYAQNAFDEAYGVMV